MTACKNREPCYNSAGAIILLLSNHEMDSKDEEDLCEYERKRLQNIKRNHEHLRSLGKLYSYLRGYVIEFINGAGPRARV